MAVYCAGQSLTSCSQSGVAPAPLSGPFTVDLTSAANTTLKNVGGYIITNNVVVANTSQGFVAATVVCSHEGLRQVILRNNEFFCTAHDARFILTGKGLNSVGNKGLTIYSVSQSGNVLTIS